LRNNGTLHWHLAIKYYDVTVLVGLTLKSKTPTKMLSAVKKFKKIAGTFKEEYESIRLNPTLKTTNTSSIT